MLQEEPQGCAVHVGDLSKENVKVDNIGIVSGFGCPGMPVGDVVCLNQVSYLPI